ncbi:MAG: hypothetical protein CVT67_04060 [Actinobacteria bacterium HGW-Actinobacteria-7]|nr:MAG: hypothetical protein CVT67_04060 [Actinobacteria bacterium HGW-Actinobacteria-7]
MRRFGHTIVLALAMFVALPGVALAAVPLGVQPAEVTAHQWELPQSGGVFRADGASALDENGGYTPEPGDRLDVEYREGLRLSFFNVGVQGGVQYAEARIDFVREYLSPGLEVPKAKPREIGGKVQDTDGQSENVPAKDVLDPYAEPVYFLTFSGGPTGRFTQTGGVARVDGPINGEVVREALDGLHYIELRPLYIRLSIDDPNAFLGWSGEKSLPDGVGLASEEDTAVAARLVSYSGRVMFAYPDGKRATLRTGSTDMTRYRIPLGTIISTGEGSFLELEYTDGARYVLGAHSSVELLRREAYGARLRRGRALVGHPDTADEAGSRTAMNFGVVAGAHSEWVLTESPQASTLTVLSGRATFAVPGGAHVAELGSGTMVKATKNGLGTVKKVDSRAILSEWKALRRNAVPLGGRDPLSMPGVVPGIGLAVVAVAVGMLAYGKRQRDKVGS